MTNEEILNEIKKHLINLDEWTFEIARTKNGIKCYPKYGMISSYEILKIIHIAQTKNLNFYISAEIGEDIPYIKIYN